MFRVTYPDSCLNERAWIVELILHDFLGIEYKSSISETSFLTLEWDDRKIEISDDFFTLAKFNWLKSESLPTQPLKYWDTRELLHNIKLLRPVVPIIYGDGFVTVSSNRIRLGLDIFGSSFFMLTRYEEIVKNDRDPRNRFPASASLAFQEGFLNRPIVNEYLEILWTCMQILWPSLDRRSMQYTTYISADVDQPYSCGTKRPVHQLKQISADILLRRDIKRASHNTLNYFLSKFGNYSYDPYLSKFEWMMDVNEKVGNKIAFHFIAGHTDKKIDGCYSLNESIIRSLLQRINQRGHEVALHPSYNSYNDIEQIIREVRNLRKVKEECGINQATLGSRQHYLRWSSKVTANLLCKAGVDYDTTLSYADHIGFRCGICYEYTMFDLIKRKKLAIKERPLIVMETTIFQYMGQSDTSQIIETISYFKDVCQMFSGDFVYLWHNSNFVATSQTEIYLSTI